MEQSLSPKHPARTILEDFILWYTGLECLEPFPDAGSHAVCVHEMGPRSGRAKCESARELYVPLRKTPPSANAGATRTRVKN